MQISLEMQPEEDKSKKTPHERQNSFLFSNFLKKKKKICKRSGEKSLYSRLQNMSYVDDVHLQPSAFLLLKHCSKFCLLKYYSPK